MDIEQIRLYCLQKMDVEESTPFGPQTLVFKCRGKIFMLLPLDQYETLSCTLKCDPEYAIDLRADYIETVFEGYHMNKRHWNTVYCNRQLSDARIFELIDHSYQLIV
ncbi:MmcQ/YjbR family DNA-binding protein [Sphingobacterium sp. UT-1RO-CII-1]|uniref:MmcQ/YjbR family DNA-binding protein n=1 Tax=Sphingobacterium sp. UT-1RO-CII-1 TaxID=2995225 RepID=UPI00227C2363|nr:MmcQ/YjbR family DNA-binding protein [Sphingobacterium sp. UT-1RO-CII-1]MCY4781070.1 MmcQ/YjbR family DNA-binding protein [Sphingobacterium sp. UT-1RO-CII-1]